MIPSFTSSKTIYWARFDFLPTSSTQGLFFFTPYFWPSLAYKNPRSGCCMLMCSKWWSLGVDKYVSEINLGDRKQPKVLSSSSVFFLFYYSKMCQNLLSKNLHRSRQTISTGTLKFSKWMGKQVPEWEHVLPIFGLFLQILGVFLYYVL